MDIEKYRKQREKMVAEHIVAKGINNKNIVDAFLKVPRHDFIPEESKNSSYINAPVSIGHGQTISQPYIVAYMLLRLEIEKGDKVLEIGTGSGYQTVLLCELCSQVYSVEVNEELSKNAEQTVYSLGYKNVVFIIGDGYEGYSEAAPYDKIIVSAATREVPEKLVEQLNTNGGKLLLPIGDKIQNLILVEKFGEELKKTRLSPVKFVPLVKE